MAWLLAVPSLVALIVAGASSDTNWSAPLAQYGLAGVLLAFILWLYLDERKEHKALRLKVLGDVIPALVANNEQLRASSDVATRMLGLVDQNTLANWTATMNRVDETLRRAGG